MKNNTPRLPLREIRKLLGQSLRLKAKGRAAYILSGDALSDVRKLLPPDVPVKLRDGRTFVIEDRYAAADVAFTNAKVERFTLKEVKAPAVRPASRRKGGAE